MHRSFSLNPFHLCRHENNLNDCMRFGLATHYSWDSVQVHFTGCLLKHCTKKAGRDAVFAQHTSTYWWSRGTKCLVCCTWERWHREKGSSHLPMGCYQNKKLWPLYVSIITPAKPLRRDLVPGHVARVCLLSKERCTLLQCSFSPLFCCLPVVGLSVQD